MVSKPSTRQNRGRVTMRDVARLANVSQSTVSRVLNRSDEPIPIGEDTQRRVMDAVRKLGFQPNQHARSLRGQRTYLIAMLIADIANQFYHPMVRAVQDVARRHGCDVMVTNSDHSRANELAFCESLVRRPVDGAVLIPYHLNEEDLGRLIQRTGLHISALGQHLNHPLVDTVYGTDDTGIEVAVRWLHQAKGHRRIGYIGVTSEYSVGARRAGAFARGLESVGLAVEPAWIREGDWSYESGRQAMAELLDLPQRPSAVFACNDLMALGAMAEVQKRNLRIPEDVAIVGLDDIPAACWVHPQLTTVAQYPAEMGALMASSLFDRIEGTLAGPAQRYEVPCQLIVRQTT
jgi:LacI family transcriptional regulator